MADLLVLLLEEVVESGASVWSRNRAVIDAESNHAIGRIPDFVLSSALISTGADFWSTGILIAVSGPTIRQGRNRDVGDGTGRNGVFEGIKPLLRDIRIQV